MPDNGRKWEYFLVFFSNVGEKKLLKNLWYIILLCSMEMLKYFCAVRIRNFQLFQRSTALLTLTTMECNILGTPKTPTSYKYLTFQFVLI